MTYRPSSLACHALAGHVLAVVVAAAMLAGCSTGVDGGTEPIPTPPGPGPEFVTITIDADGNDAWVVESVDGPDRDSGPFDPTSVADTSAPNPNWTLRIGSRYRVINRGGSAHPLALQTSSSSVILRQGGDGGSFSDDPDVNFSSFEEGMTFTFTADLAERVDVYTCLNHNTARGEIVPTSR